MDFSERQRNPARKFAGIVFVILLHVMIVYAMVTGLARDIVNVIQKPIETKIITEVKPPPLLDVTPPPAPKPVPAPKPPKLAAPAPPVIAAPAAQVAPPPLQKNAMAAVSNVPLDNPVPPTPVAPPPAPVAAPVAAPPAPVKVAAVIDPNACAKPAYPRNAMRAGEEGVVTVAFLVGIDGLVLEARVDQSSGFRDLDNAAVAGLSLCKFKPGTVNGKPEQSRTRIQYVWKLE